MKRLLCLLVLLTTLLSAACAEAPLAIWPKEHAPQRILHVGDCWYAMMGTYGGPDAELAVGPSPDALETVYQADAYVWSFVASQTHAAWTQRTAGDGTLEWMLYDRATGETTLVHSEPEGDVRPCFSIALTQDRLYYVRNEGSDGAGCVYVRSLADGTDTPWGEAQGRIGAIAVRSDMLVLVQQEESGWTLHVMDTSGRREYKALEMPERVAQIYDVDYDPSTGLFGLYYMDTENAEHAALLTWPRMYNLFTFSRGVYALGDNISLVDGHFRWTVQIEASGYVTDHYRVVDYDVLHNQPVEHLRSYWCAPAEEGLLVLSFNADGAYDGCEMHVYPDE